MFQGISTGVFIVKHLRACYYATENYDSASQGSGFQLFLIFFFLTTKPTEPVEEQFVAVALPGTHFGAHSNPTPANQVDSNSPLRT